MLVVFSFLIQLQICAKLDHKQEKKIEFKYQSCFTNNLKIITQSVKS